MKTDIKKYLTIWSLLFISIFLTLSPCFAATFVDVPASHWAYEYIEAIYSNGITRGCSQNPLMYCPDQNVTRGQMAAFIIRAKYGETFNYTTTPYFSDVPSMHTFFKYVQKLKDDGITAVSGIYGVDNEVTRGQMAAFIIRALYGENFNYTTTPYFSDVPPTHVFFKYIQKLKDDGITSVSGTYGVDNIVTRAQMAAFLVRGFLSSEFVRQLVALDTSVNQRQISEDEFIMQLRNIFKRIEDTPYGIQSLQTYLEEEILGYTFSWSATAKGPNTLGVHITSTGIKDIINEIKNSNAYKMLEAFLESVIFSLTPEPGGSLIQVARPETFVTLSTVQVRTHINDAYYSGQITFEKYNELLGIVTTNPFEAERQLLRAQNKPVPSWLAPAPSGCVRNCTGYCGDGICDPSLGETTNTCPSDCHPQGYCGDGICDPDLGESTITCPGDCPLTCGDGFCNVAGGELQSCPQDCPQSQCCIDTNGCPPETPYECPGACCCCPWGQTCCWTAAGWVCCGG